MFRMLVLHVSTVLPGHVTLSAVAPITHGRAPGGRVKGLPPKFGGTPLLKAGRCPSVDTT